jgi:uncharacterized protein (DUF1697 family)
MTRWVALLRGINVGGSGKMPMARLREIASEIGFTEVQTYIQSGNLVFSAKGTAEALAARIDAALAETVGHKADAVVRSAADWKKDMAGNPFPTESATDPGRVFLVLGRTKPDAGTIEKLRAKATLGERVEPAGDGLWVHYPQGAGKSKIGSFAGATARNWRTVQAIDAMLAG